MRVGLLGGTFDPIHRGHLDVADAARRAMQLEQIWFVPARQPPHRKPPTAPAAHRFAMVALALAGRQHLRLSDIEMDTTGPSYTIETLNRLEHSCPELIRPLCFVTGADAFRDIQAWRCWEELLDRCHFAVVSRPGVPAAGLRDALPDLAGRMREPAAGCAARPAIFLIDAPTADVSSTRLRSVLRNTIPSSDLLPAAVAEYAVREGLYAGPENLETPRG